MVAQGSPEALMRGDILQQIYGIPMGTLAHPSGGVPLSFVY
jgi:iron complex transport system ATP-binding protein